METGKKQKIAFALSDDVIDFLKAHRPASRTIELAVREYANRTAQTATKNKLENKMDNLIYLALADDKTVVAQFSESEAARKFCNEKDLCSVPFNINNAAQTQIPQTGHKYLV